MAEALAAASAIGGLIELSGAILAIGYTYIYKVAHAPKQAKELLAEIASLNTVLDGVKDVLDESNAVATRSTLLQKIAKAGAIESCKDLLDKAETNISVFCAKDGKQDSSSKLLHRSIWPLKEKETKAMMDRLREMRELFTSALSIDSASSLHRIENRLDELTISSKSDRFQDQLDKISKRIFPLKLADVQESELLSKASESPTGQWLFELSTYQSWITGRGSILWLYGIPGCGKTVLASSLIRMLTSRDHKIPNSSIAYFYCNENYGKEDVVRSFLMSIAEQLLRSSPPSVGDVEALLESKYDNESRWLTNEDYSNIISLISNQFRCVFLVVDALDELWAVEDVLTELLKLIESTPSTCSFNMAITSRNTGALEQLVSSHATYKVAVHDYTEAEIRSYVEVELDKRLSRRPIQIRELQRDIFEEIVQKSDGLFLQAKLQVEHVCSLRTAGQIKRCLNNLPSGLGPMYDSMLSQLCTRFSDCKQMMKELFRWMAGALVPLRLSAVAHAMALRIEDKVIDEEEVVDAEDLAELCGSFLSLERNVQGELVARLSHHSVMEYFKSDALTLSNLSEFSLKHQDEHFHLAQACITYLSLNDFSNIFQDKIANDEESKTFRERHPLYSYAAEHWWLHLRRSSVSRDIFTAEILPQLKWFCHPSGRADQYFTWQKWVSQTALTRPLLSSADPITTFTHSWKPPIAFAIEFGLVWLFDELFKNIDDPDLVFSNGLTLLCWTILCNQIKIVKRILDLNAKTDLIETLTGKFMSALHIAAEAGNFRLVNLLLNYGATPDLQSRSGATPFYRAVKNGSTQVMTLLQANGANVNVRTWDRWTPVFEAVRQGHVGPLTLLLEWGADPCVVTLAGQSPIMVAKARGRLDIVELLERYAAKSAHEQPALDHVSGPIPAEAGVVPLTSPTSSNRTSVAFREEVKEGWYCCRCSHGPWFTLDDTCWAAICRHYRCPHCPSSDTQLFLVT